MTDFESNSDQPQVHRPQSTALQRRYPTRNSPAQRPLVDILDRVLALLVYELLHQQFLRGNYASPSLPSCPPILLFPNPVIRAMASPSVSSVSMNCFYLAEMQVAWLLLGVLELLAIPVPSEIQPVATDLSVGSPGCTRSCPPCLCPCACRLASFLSGLSGVTNSALVVQP